jgi:hypothetical protein
VQGPFEFSPDGQKLSFSSPRNGNFDIYVATLDDAGKDALKRLSSETELAPALAAAGHPAGLSTKGNPTPASAAAVPGVGQTSSGQTVPPQAAASAPAAAAAPSVPQNEPGILPSGISPYLLALAGLAVVWVLVEGVMIARRRNRRRGTPNDGQ